MAEDTEILIRRLPFTSSALLDFNKGTGREKEEVRRRGEGGGGGGGRWAVYASCPCVVTNTRVTSDIKSACFFHLYRRVAVEFAARLHRLKSVLRRHYPKAGIVLLLVFVEQETDK